MREFFFTLLGFIVADTADRALGDSVDLSASDFYFIDAMLVADKPDYCWRRYSSIGSDAGQGSLS